MNKIIVLALLLAFSGCDESNDPVTPANNVAGSWQASIRVDSCSPAQTCVLVGFVQGNTVTALMNLAQNGSDVNGNYAYQGVGIASEISGNVATDRLVLDGTVTNLLGRATTHLTGTVSGNSIDASVTHQVTLTNGSSVSVAGVGVFQR